MENVSDKQKENSNASVLALTENTEMATFSNASMLQLTAEEKAAINAPTPPEDFEIRPDGFLYLPQALFRQTLNRIFGNGQWALIMKGLTQEELSPKKIRINFTGCLYIRGCFISMATGEQIYFTDNDNGSYAKGVEGAKSDCLVRCCKDLGIASESWQPSFSRKWQKEYAVKVWVEDKDTKKKAVMWRRRDVDPFWNETGLYNNQPHVKEQEKKIDNPPVTDVWIETLKQMKTKNELVGLYNGNKSTIDEWPALKDAFKKRETELPKAQTHNS